MSGTNLYGEPSIFTSEAQCPSCGASRANNYAHTPSCAGQKSYRPLRPLAEFWLQVAAVRREMFLEDAQGLVA